MPKIGMEPVRRKALIEAAIKEIGEEGSLDVTMSRIASRAGVSSALAHHYFGGKGDLLTATMRHLLWELERSTSRQLRKATTPRERLHGLVKANIAPDQFKGATVAAWLAFYVQAQSSPEARRLLRVYSRRLHSNLAWSFRAFFPKDVAHREAQAAAALIDGLWIRQALGEARLKPSEAQAIVRTFIDRTLGAAEGGN